MPPFDMFFPAAIAVLMLLIIASARMYAVPPSRRDDKDNRSIFSPGPPPPPPPKHGPHAVLLTHDELLRASNALGSAAYEMEKAADKFKHSKAIAESFKMAAADYQELADRLALIACEAGK